MPVTHGVTGSSPVRTAINIENQCFTKQTPDFTPKNVKSGVLYLELPDFIFARIVEKPRDFDPFGQAGLSPLATI